MVVNNVRNCKRTNRKFWNDHIRYNIKIIRKLQLINDDKSRAFIQSYTCTVIEGLESRKNYKYLNKGLI